MYCPPWPVQEGFHDGSVAILPSHDLDVHDEIQILHRSVDHTRARARGKRIPRRAECANTRRVETLTSEFNSLTRSFGPTWSRQGLQDGCGGKGCDDGHEHEHGKKSRSSSNFYCPDLLLRKARGIQALLQQQDFLIAFDASELFLCFQESCGGPAQRLISFSPTLYVARHPLHRGPTRLNRVGGGRLLKLSSGTTESNGEIIRAASCVAAVC